jgi:SAM-dependent methyltransferase
MINYFKRNKWEPSFYGIFFMPNFLERFSLYLTIKRLSPNFRGEILDVGCGKKPYKNLFNVMKYLGLEISGANETDADFFYDGKNFPFDDNRFDCVVSIQALYQSSNSNILFKEINRILKPKGYLLISLPFSWFDSDTANNYEERFSQNKIRSILTENNFELVSVDKLNSNLTYFISTFNSFLAARFFSSSFLLNFKRILHVPIIFFLNILGLISLLFSSGKDYIYTNVVFFAFKK